MSFGTLAKDALKGAIELGKLGGPVCAAGTIVFLFALIFSLTRTSNPRSVSLLVLVGAILMIFSAAYGWRALEVSRGAHAEVDGDYSVAVAGDAGVSGVRDGGVGGDAKVKGNHSMAVGGGGINSAQRDGRGGAPAKSGGERLGLGTDMWKFGRGGEGQHSSVYKKRLDMLTQARLKYMNDFPGDAVLIKAGVLQVPVLWINKFLEESKENWSVELRDGVYILPDLKVEAGRKSDVAFGFDGGGSGEYRQSSLDMTGIHHLNIKVGEGGKLGKPGEDSKIEFVDNEGKVVKTEIAKGGVAPEQSNFKAVRTLVKNDLENGFQVAGLMFSNSAKLNNRLFDLSGAGWDFFGVASTPFEFSAPLICKIDSGKVLPDIQIQLVAKVYDPSGVEMNHIPFVVSGNNSNSCVMVMFSGNKIGTWHVDITSGSLKLGRASLQIKLQDKGNA